MKRKIGILGVFFALCSSPNIIWAQNSEISLGVGYYNSALWHAGFGEYTYHCDGAPQTYIIYYKYIFNNVVALGASLGMFNDRGDYYYNADHKTENVHIGTYVRSTAIISPELALTYYSSKYFSMYLVIGIGCRISNSSYTYTHKWANQYSSNVDTTTPSDTKLIPMIQATPLALRFGDNIGCNIEIGLGYKGLINFGFYCKF